ncbi:MAG: hypothetical protein FWC92_02290 [Defluviitaleaceae bacterium]|nr:hypothetical protein [Defluviitaleaceae bacterium]
MALVAVMFIIIISLVFVVALAVLQVYLSKRESMWPGLILPAVTFGISMMRILGIALFSIVSTTTTMNVAIHDTAVEDMLLAERFAIVERYSTQETVESEPRVLQEMVNHYLVDYGTIRFDFVSTIFFLLIGIAVSNIPTAILLAIYFICRKNRTKLAAVDMMSLQDL